MKLTEVLHDLSIEAAPASHHHVTRDWTNIDCPFCSPNSRRFRLGINERSLVCSCWTCGIHRLYDVLRESSQNSPVFLSGRLGDTLAQLRAEIEKTGHFSGIKRPLGKLELPTGLGELLPEHKRYLKERKLCPDELSKLWSVQGIGIHHELSWRIFMPVILNGETVSWTTRSISDHVSKRYIAASVKQESVSVRSVLAGEDYCRHAVCVVEGLMGVYAIGPGAVATCGVGYSSTQLLRMSKYPLRIIAFDNDLNAIQRAHKLACDLSVFDGETIVVKWTGKDAGESPKSDIKQIRRMLK